MASRIIAWEMLEHAYGSAGDIPALLGRLSTFPQEGSHEDEPWFSLWSSLYHQGDIYPASFAAVVEIVQLLAQSPEKATPSFFSLPASIEIARAEHDISVPTELGGAYRDAIAALAGLAAKAIEHRPDVEVSRAASAAFAVAAGQFAYAELLLEIGPDEIAETLEWFFSR